MMRRKRYGNRGSARPSRTWLSLGSSWAITSAASTTAVKLLELQAPTSLSLTSDPPEDLTVLRVVGEFSVIVDTPLGNWVLGLVVQDTDWTPSALFGADADKRILWSQNYVNAAAMGAEGWTPPGVLSSQGSRLPCHPTNVRVDISPKVRLEAGKALYLCAWEQVNGATFTTATSTMRLLFQRSGRR